MLHEKAFPVSERVLMFLYSLGKAFLLLMRIRRYIIRIYSFMKSSI